MRITVFLNQFIARVVFVFALVLASVSFAVQAADELIVTVSSSNDVYENGAAIEYQVTVLNNTDARIDDISVSDTFWSDSDIFSSAQMSANLLEEGLEGLGNQTGTLAAESDADLSVTGASLGKGDSVTYHIIATVKADVTGDISLGNTTVSASVGDFTPSSTLVLPPAPYQYDIQLVASDANYIANGTLTYTLTAVNTGDYTVQGLNLSADFASVIATDMNGTDVAAFQSVSTSADNGAASDAGSFTTSGDLVVTGATLAKGDTLTYTITTQISDGLVGDIVTLASSQTSQDNKTTELLTTPAAPAEVTLSHSASTSDAYLINENMTFTLEVSNVGGGIAYDYHVKHNISELISSQGLANDLTGAHNQADVDGNPFNSWQIEVLSIGSKSLSNFSSAGLQTDVVFDDVVSIYPGESISYQITATIAPIAIGKISGINAGVFDASENLIQDGQIADIRVAERVLEVGDAEISIKKTTSASEYIPGDEVVYDITVSNSSDKYFANNLQIIDDIECIETDYAGGTGIGQAFSQWKLEVASPSPSDAADGTDPGAYSYGTWQTSAITLSPDIAPGQQVQYTLTAKVADASIGTILDGSGCDDNVTESGSGIQMPDDNLRASKESDARLYSAGGTITYTIRIDNDGDGTANKVPVLDELSKIQTTDIYGNTINAFTGWTITSAAYNADNTEITTNVETITGIPSGGSISGPDNDLNVTATIPQHSYIIYTVVAMVDPLANGHITNSMTVDENVYADRGSDPKDFDLTVEKKVMTNTDTGFHTEETGYSKLDNEITYQIRVKNFAGNGYATNVKIKDEISKITANLLEPDEATKPVFKTWQISAEIISSDPVLNGNATYTDVGSFADNTDLDVTAQIAPNVEVVYTIVAQIDRSVPTEIIYKKFTNTVTVDSDSKSQGTISDSALVYPHEPDILVVKTSPTPSFAKGEWVTFDIKVYNRGQGYATEVKVFDDLIGMGIFSEWAISSDTDSNNTDYQTGSFADVKTAYPDDGNIVAYADIDPKTADGPGWVSYQIIGKIKDDLDDSIKRISNTVEVHDPVHNTDYSSSAEVGVSLDSLNVSIVKTADMAKYRPGQDLVYSIYIENNGATTASILKVTDAITELKATLANDKDNQFADFVEQQPFEYWQFSYDAGATWTDPTSTDDFVYPVDGSLEILSLPAGERREFQIKARIKDNVVSDILENDAYVYQNFGTVDEKSHVSHHEMRRADNGADTVRTLLVNGVESRYYAPGDTLTYQVKVYSNLGYYNNHAVNENLTGIDVLLADGTKAHPFSVVDGSPESGVFTVEVETEDSEGGEGTTDGTLDGTVADNQDIATTIDVAGGDYVLYTVTGIAREDAVGDITIGGITVKPYDYQLSFQKTVEEGNYQPDGTLTYHLTITNTGKGNAYNIPVVDELSAVTVTLMNGDTGPAYQAGWTITTATTGSETAAQVDLDGNLADGANINTHASIPAGGSVDYIVTTKINPNAVGNIVNLLKVDGDTVGSNVKPATERFDFEKVIKAYYDTDGVTELTGGYTPGGYVEYEINLLNNNNVHLNDLTIKDDISSIETEYYDGSAGPAFTDWTIRTETDASGDIGLSDAGSVSDNANIDTTFDLAASSFATGGTYVRYIIKARVSEKAVGSFSNTAVVNGSHTLDSGNSRMLTASITKTHKAYTDVTLTTEKTTYNHTTDGQKVVYHLRLENTGKGTEYNKSLSEIFSTLNVRLAQIGAGDLEAKVGPVYTPKGWKVEVTTSAELVTDIGDFVGGNDIDIDIAKLSIAPGGWIDFVIETDIRDDALGAISIAPKYGKSGSSGSSFSTSNISPEAEALAVSKKIVSIGGRSYSSGDFYKPGEEVIYQFSVENTESVWYDQALLRDLVSNITVEVLGGGVEEAFTSTTISHAISNGIDSDVDTYLPTYVANANLKIQADIAPLETITFTITGTLRSDALGDVAANSATGGDSTVTTELIPPVAADIQFEKRLIDTTADNDGSCSLPTTVENSGCQYAPGGQVSYEIVVTNKGDGIANDVTIVDKLNEIKTSAGGAAFSDYSVRILEQPSLDRFSIEGDYSKTLDATFDLMPDDTVKFELQGTVADDAIGSITNVATVNSSASNAITLTQGEAIIKASKKANIETYTPGSEVSFTITMENQSDTNAILEVVDTISSYTVMTVDGTEKTALKDWTVTATVPTDTNPSVTDISCLIPVSGFPPSTDIDCRGTNQIELAAASGGLYTKVQIDIVGHVRDDAVGSFNNTVTVTVIDDINGNKTANYKSADILPEQGLLKVTKVATKTGAEYAEYESGEEIGFDITVENIGSGYVTDVLIKDLAKSIKADIAGDNFKGKVFDGWSKIETSVTASDGSDTKLTQVVAGSTEITDADGYQAYYHIHPGDKVNVSLKGVVKPEVMGDITNTVTVTDSSGTQEASATYTPTDVELTISKSVEPEKYEAGDTLTYTLTLTNNSASWAKDVAIKDMFNQITSQDIHGNTVTAFESGSFKIENVTIKGDSDFSGIVAVGEYIDDVFEIAPNEEIVATISGQLKENIIGEVTNTVYVTYQPNATADPIELSDSASSTAAEAELTLSKVASDDYYTPGQNAGFTLTLTNTTNSFATGVVLQDIISELMVDTVSGSEEMAFSHWYEKAFADKAETEIVRNHGESKGVNDDIDYTINLAPNDVVTVAVIGKVNGYALTDIDNTATVEFNSVSTPASASLLAPESSVKLEKMADGDGFYTPGESAIFYVKLINNGDGFATGITVEDIISTLTVDSELGGEEKAFDSWQIKPSASDSRSSLTPLPEDNLDISSVADVAPGDTIEFEITTLVNSNAMGDITNIATADLGDGFDPLTAQATIYPKGVLLVVDKVADKADYTNEDEEVIYTMTATNRGSSAVSVDLIDEVSLLVGENGAPLFDSWTATVKELPSGTVVNSFTDQDVHSTQTLLAYEANSFEITIVGHIGKGLDDDITNTFTVNEVTDGCIPGETCASASASVTIHVKKFADNEGELVVNKEALQDEAQVGDVVEYQVTIQNNNESQFNSVVLVDRYPSGFQYVPGSAEVVNSGADGVFDTSDDVVSTSDPIISDGKLNFSVGDMLVHTSADKTINEQVRVRYLLRVSVGVIFGDYINTAYAMTPPEGQTSGSLEIKSNQSSAVVQVVPDKLFDTASIIGKVFEDHNGDGYQADATAYGVKLKIDIDSQQYIDNSTVLYRHGRKSALSDDALTSGYKIGQLFGISLNRTLAEDNKVEFEFKTRSEQSFALRVTSNEGSDITFDENGQITVNKDGDIESGLSAENLDVTRTLYRDGDSYLWRITIENKGIYEDGIPGVRLMTVEGIVIMTDQYGRYHVPDQWVLNKKGKNFLVKVDSDSLPTGMKVISENPMVQRITPNKLSKFNFSIATDKNK